MASNTRIEIAAILTLILSFTAIDLVIYLLVHFNGGYTDKWQFGDARIFNYHPLFMVIGFIFLAPTGAAVYRLSPSFISKFWQKIIHFSIQFTALIFGSVGLAAVIKYHNDHGYKNFIDIHSWCGLASFGLFTLQLLGGFISFLFPRLPDGPRSKVAKWHAISGKIIVLLLILTAITGVTRFYNVTNLTKEQKTVNSLVMVLYVLFAVVFYMLTQSSSRSCGSFGRLQNEGFVDTS